MAQRSLRDALLNAAAAEFHEKGFSATGVAAVAARAGAPKGSFYNHFPSKDDLGVLVVEAYADSRGAGLLLDPDAEPVDALRRHFEYLRDEQLAPARVPGCLLGNFAAEVSGSDSKVDDAVRVSLAGWFEAIEVPVRKLVGDQAAAGVARALGSAWEGSVLMAKALGHPLPISDFFAVTFPLVLGLPVD